MADDSDPWFVLIAGVNGSGKSTFAQPAMIAGLLDESDANAMDVINPDTETQRIRSENPALSLEEANLLAARSAEKMVRDRIAEKRGHFAIETVLSTDKYRDIVIEAIRLGLSKSPSVAWHSASRSAGMTCPKTSCASVGDYREPTCHGSGMLRRAPFSFETHLTSECPPRKRRSMDR